MQTKWIRVSVCALCLGLVAAVAAQNQAPSVLDRARSVEDPDLGELIRAALERRSKPSEQETREIIRKVTLSYTQIKLLDRQIEQLAHKLKSATGPAEMRYELLLAQAQLEAKLATELVDLRDIMGVIPKYPFDEQPLRSLSTRLRLNPIDDDRVYVLDTSDAKTDYWAMVDHQSVGVMSQADTIDWIRKRLSDPNDLPVRIDIHWKNEAGPVLRDKVIRAIKDIGAEMQTEVRLERNSFIGSGKTPYYLRKGTVTTFYPAPVRRPGKRADDLFVNGPVDPADLEDSIRWRMTMQWNLPVTFHIEYDRASFDLAQRLADEIETVAKDLGVTELVDVESVLVEPIPPEVFTGKWQAITKGEISGIDVDPGGECRFTLGKRCSFGRPGDILTCQWYLTTKEIVLDPRTVVNGDHRDLCRGHIDKEGNLVTYRGVFYPQGSFHLQYPQPTILDKVK